MIVAKELRRSQVKFRESREQSKEVDYCKVTNDARYHVEGCSDWRDSCFKPWDCGVSSLPPRDYSNQDEREAVGSMVSADIEIA